jgi:ELWxxDGT repeat protein
MLRAVVPVALALLALLPTAAPAAAPAAQALVRDLDPRPHDPNGGGNLPGQFFPAGPRAVFTQQYASGAGLSELWATDGTPAGTERLRAFPAQLRVLGSTGEVVFFAVRTVVDGRLADASDLWRSDGTREGTFPLGIVLGVDPTSPDLIPATALVFHDALLFSGCAPAWGCEPWTSDGTPAGTRRLREIVPGTGGSAPRGFAAFKGRVYFFAGGPAGVALWQSDGTNRGTQPVIGLPPFASPRHLVVQGARLYFTEGAGLFSSAVGPHLWTSDGTAAGTRPVPPFAATRSGGGPQVIDLLSGLGDRAIFLGLQGKRSFQLWITDPAARSAHPLTHVAPLPPDGGELPFGDTIATAGGRLLLTIGGRLWTSRGTLGDTRPLDGCPAGCPAQAEIWGGLPTSPGEVLFAAGSRESGFSLWTTDGTGVGTRKRIDLCSGPCNAPPALAAILLGKVYFYFGDQLWVTNASPAGTLPLADHPVTFVDFNLPPPIYAAGDRVFFPVFSTATGTELLMTDGTRGGTAFLASQEDGASSFPQGFFPFGQGVLFYTCIDGTGQPWSSDGTAAGTLLLPGLTRCQGPQSGSDPPLPFLRLGEAAIYVASTEDFVNRLWRTDGTPQGSASFFVPGEDEGVTGVATVFRDRFFFTTATDSGTRFWASDGTAAGTARLFSSPLQFVFGLKAVGDRLVFVADRSNGESDLWVSDGTEAGTRMLLAEQGEVPHPFFAFGGTFYFSLSGTLWRTDLTPEGTVQVLPNDASPGPYFGLERIVPFAGSLYFIAQTGSPYDNVLGDSVLYRSDGTAAGTTAVKDLGPVDPAFFEPPASVVASGFLYFVNGDAEHGQELWRTDGTPAGTVRIADLQPGAESSDPQELTADGDRLFFTADDGEHGRELWVTRGVPGDPQPLARRTDGTLSLSPAGLTVAGDTLFFSADDSVNGRELWRLPLALTTPLTADHP